MKFFLSALFRSFYSISFYKEAIGRPVKSALKVFVLFSIITGIVWGLINSLSLGLGYKAIEGELEYFPTIQVDGDGLTIQNLEMPFEIQDSGSYVGIDTTGSLSEIPSDFVEGILFRKDVVVIRSIEYEEDLEVGYEEILASLEQSDIYMDSETLKSFLGGLVIVLMCILPFWGIVANFIVLGLKVVIVTLMGAVIIGFLNKEKAFENSFKIALYIAIPIYLVNMLWNWIYMFGSQFQLLLNLLCMVGIVIWIVKWIYFWGLGYYSVYVAVDKATDKSNQ